MQSLAGDGDETVKIVDKDYTAKDKDSDRNISYRAMNSKRRVGNAFNSANFEMGVGVKPGSSNYNYPMTNRTKDTAISKQATN